MIDWHFYIYILNENILLYIAKQVELYKTGGGAGKPVLDDLERRIIALCSDQFIPPDNPTDDCFYNCTMQDEHTILIIYVLYL